MAGIKLRMPPGEFWQFLGESIGANPTPVAYAEVYTALQSGAIDGQDNPLVASKLMKFYEVTTQFVLTGACHRLRRDGDQQQDLGRDDARRSRRRSRRPPRRRSTTTSSSSARRKRTSLEFFKADGKKIYTPDLERVPHVRAEEVPRQVRRATGPRARWSASTRSVAIRSTRRALVRRPARLPADGRQPRGRRRDGDARPRAIIARNRMPCRSPGSPLVAGSSAAPRTSIVALIALMFVSFLLQIAFRYLLNRPLGLDRGSDGALLGVGGAVGRGVHAVGQGRDPLRHRLRPRLRTRRGARSR